MKILKLIVFISGAILMSLEIVGSRVLSPYFGNSVFVWSSLISVFLMSLSFGYHLGGKLSDLNQYRGIPDALDVTKFDDHAIILADFGEGVIDLEKDTISKNRSMPYNSEDLHARIETISTKLMDYEREVALPIDKINFKRMLIPSYERAIKRSPVTNDYYFLIEAVNSVNEAPKFLLNSNPANPLMHEFDESSDIPQPYSHIRIDYRYLFGLLTGIYHWDNAEIGSHYRTLRHPDCYNREAQGFLNFLSVC